MAKDDQLSLAFQKRLESFTGKPEQADGLLPGDDGPQPVPSGATLCHKRALELAPLMRRFNRYRKDLPFARAALDMSNLKEPKKDPPCEQKCLTRLPADADQLCDALGLKRGAIKKKDLENDKSGFRVAFYRNEETGKLIMVPRDTDRNSVIDWKTNTENAMGRDPDQYKQMRALTTLLRQQKLPNGKPAVNYDIAGYSKGGGLAQEAGLMNERAKVVVFNSAGLSDASLSPKRTGAKSFDLLKSRTTAYSSENDFLTYMNNTTDPEQRIRNLEFLSKALQGKVAAGKLKLKYSSTAVKDGSDPGFETNRDTYISDLEQQIKEIKQNYNDTKKLPDFTPVHAAHAEVVHDSGTWLSNRLGAKDQGPNLGKLNQHVMNNVADPMEESVKEARKELLKFNDQCG